MTEDADFYIKLSKEKGKFIVISNYSIDRCAVYGVCFRFYSKITLIRAGGTAEIGGDCVKGFYGPNDVIKLI